MYHAGLTAERWAALSLRERLLHIGAELIRLQRWLDSGDEAAARACVERALELFDLTVLTCQPGVQRRELCRAREIVRGFLLTHDQSPDLPALMRVFTGGLSP